MAEPSAHWTDEQKRIYGRVFRFMSANATSMRHPQSADIPADQWETVCHNAAWLAAEFLEPGDLVIRDVDTDEVIASTNAGALH